MDKLQFGLNKSEDHYYLVIYDISSTKRRKKISKILEGFGYRVQMSAFECCLSERQLRQMKEKMKNTLVREDKVRIYPIPARCTDVNGIVIPYFPKTDLYIC